MLIKGRIITSVTLEPGRFGCATSPRLPPSNNETASPAILARSLERCEAVSSSCERKFRTIVHSLFSGCEGGMMSLLMKPGNLPMTVLWRASSSAPIQPKWLPGSSSVHADNTDL
jgi:hypothetical protein